MPYTQTAADLKAYGPIRNISGLCPDSAAFLDVANEAQRRLLRRGNWWDTEWLVQLCVDNSCVTWPRYVGTVLGIRDCQNGSVDLQNRWYSILGRDCCTGWSGFGVGDQASVTWDTDSAPTYNCITGSMGKLIRYYVVKRNDVGKKIRIFGIQFGGQPLQEKDANGNWIDGLTITAAAPYASTSVYVTKITSVIRETTQGLAYLYEYDVSTDKLRDLALYEPNETHPRYRRSTIGGFCQMIGCTDANGVTRKRIEALVKLAFIPLVNDNDFLLIDNFDALKFMFQAIKLEEANDEQLAEAKIIKAIRELNFEDRDKLPYDQTFVGTEVVGGGMILNPI